MTRGRLFEERDRIRSGFPTPPAFMAGVAVAESFSLNSGWPSTGGADGASDAPGTDTFPGAGPELCGDIG